MNRNGSDCLQNSSVRSNALRWNAYVGCR